MKPSGILSGPLTKLPKSFPREIDENLSLGLDLGVGSCGQALVYDKKEQRERCQIHPKGLPDFPGRIAFMGVRAFDIPEIREKTGGIKLKNPEWRQKKHQRRTIRRRAWRMWSIRELFVEHGLLPEDYPLDQNLWKHPPPRGKNPIFDKWRDWHSRMTSGAPGLGENGPLESRVKGLDKKLEPLEWAAALIHIAKHRGFRSNKKSEKVDEEGGKVLSALGESKKRMEQGGYRTLGEMFLKDRSYAERKRNREGSYTATAIRSEHEKEIKLLFERQRNLGSRLASEDLEKAYLDLFNAQYPLQKSVDLLGDCPFDKGEKRGARYAPSFELSRALQKLNTLNILLPDGQQIRLAEYVDAANGGYERFIENFSKSGTKSNQGRITWADLRKVFDLPEGSIFAELPSPKRKTKKDGTEKVDSLAEIEREDFVTRNNSNASAKGSYLLREALGLK